LEPTKDDRVTIYLALESDDLTTVMLTERLGVQPSKEHAIGDVRGQTGKCWDHHHWELEVTVRSNHSGGRLAQELIPIAMDLFAARVEPLARIISSLDSSVQRFVVLGILADPVPGIALSHPFLQLLADLGGNIPGGCYRGLSS